MDRFGLLCRNIYEKKKITQRELAAAMDLSLGTCNHLIRDALADGLIALDPQTGEYSLLKKGVELLQKYRVNSAVILAAGFGSRFVPLTFETPKGLLEVFRGTHDRASDQPAPRGRDHGHHHCGGLSEREI